MKIWKKSIKLTKEVYASTKTFPNEEKFNLISQIRRCSVSVPSNIAEGSSRSSKKEFSHFLRIALGSLFELETQMIIAKELEYFQDEQSQDVEIKITELQKMIYGFTRSLDS